MKCNVCKREISRVELKKAIAQYQQADSSIKTYGWDREDGKLSQWGGTTTGRLVRMYHYKCFMVMTKRVTREENQQEGATGRLAAFTPSAYEVTAMTANQDEMKMLGITPEEAAAMSTAHLSKRIAEARARAMETGYGADDWVFQERAKAENHGGPYAHKHDPRAVMDDGLLRPHLHYAHGVEDPMTLGGPTMRKMAHNEFHAVLAAQETRDSRAQDPGYVEPSESDWRDQTVVEVAHTPRVAAAEELTPVPGSSGETLSVADL